MPRQRGQSRHVIAVFVSDQNGVEVVYVLTNTGQAFRHFAAAEPGVNQDPASGQ